MFVTYQIRVSKPLTRMFSGLPLTPPGSPTSDAETIPTSDAETGDSLTFRATLYLDVPSPLPLPTEEDIKAPHPQFTLLSGEDRSITMMEAIGPPSNTKVDCVMRPFAVRAELNPTIWRDVSLEVAVCIHDANTGEQVTDDVLDGDNVITGVRSEDLDKHGETILVFDFPICGLQISREGAFYFTYWFIDPGDTTRAFWDLKGSPCKATHHPGLCKHKHITSFANHS